MPNAYIQAAGRNGGSGVICFTESISVLLLTRLGNLAVMVGHPILNPVSSSVWGQNVLAKFKAYLVRNGHSTAAPLRRHDKLWRYWTDIQQRSFSENGLRQGAESTASSSLVADPPSFWGEHFTC